MKKPLLCLFILAVTSVFALELLPGSYFVPDGLKKAGNPDDYMVLRGRHVLIVSPDVKGEFSLDLACVQIGKYPNVLRYSMTSAANGVAIGKGILNPGENTVLKLHGLPQGAYRLELDAGANAARVAHPNSKCCLCVSSISPLHAINYVPLFYFMTFQEDTLELEVTGDQAEQVAVTIRDSKDAIVFQGNTVGYENSTRAIQVPIPQEERGKIWSIKLDKVPNTPYEDSHLSILRGTEAMVALSPDQLLFPLLAPATEVLKDGRNLMGARISRLLNNDPAWEFAPEFVYKTSDDLIPGQMGQKRTAKQLFATDDGGIFLGTEYDPEKFIYGTLSVQIKHNGEDYGEASFTMASCQDIGFEEIPWTELGEAAEPTEKDFERGFQVFQRDEPGEVRPTTIIHPNEITESILAETSAELFTTEFFGVNFLNEGAEGKLAIGALKSEDGAVIPAEAIELFACPAWPQRTDWNSTTYVTIPELMLSQNESPKPEVEVPYLYAVRVHVPENATPGVYQAGLSMDGKFCATYKLTVDDFALPEVPGITFGLYADGNRWNWERFTDEEILREMRDFRDHGMNSMMIYPLEDSKITYENGEFSVELTALRNQMKLYNQVGFPGVAVLSLQAINGYLMKALHVETPDHTPEFVKGFHAILDEIRRLAEEDHWPAYCLHTVDEPDETKEADEAVKTIKLVHNAGFKTFNTCYGDFVRKYLAPYLDYRCYNNIGFMSSPTQEANEALRQETLADGDQFWWYGSGCYTNFAIQQDGNIYTNRHMLGVFTWRSKTTGAWTWTFLRQKGRSLYNDFDCKGNREPKEACICYYEPGSKKLIHTLQWEAIREGVYDYRYIVLWDNLCKAAEGTDKATRAAESRQAIQTAMDKIAWESHDHKVNNTELRALRALLIQEIKALK